MLKKCADTLLPAARDLKVRRALVGPGFIAVQLDDDSLGLCVNIIPPGTTGCTVYRKGGSLVGSRAEDLLGLSIESDFISRALALATVNALASRISTAETGDVFSHIEIREGSHAVIVGLIEPVADMLVRKGCKVSIFDDAPRSHPSMEPLNMLPKRLESADLVVLTGTTIVNGTLTDILARIGHAGEVIVMGTSTPMIPEVFSGTGVTYLAGASIKDPDRAFTIVMEGNGTRELHRSGALMKAFMAVR